MSGPGLVARSLGLTRSIGLVLLLVTEMGCNKPGGETSGSNTNWLRTCEDDSDCGGLTCSCGRCTPTCGEEQECASVGGVCSDAESTRFECRGAESPRLCLPECATSEDCGAGRLCHRGACTQSLPEIECSRSPSALVCEDFEGSTDGYDSIVTSGNSATAVEMATPSGARALAARIREAPSTAYLRAKFGPLSSGTVSVRGWIRIPSGQTNYDVAPLAFWSDQEQAWALRLVAKGGRLETWAYTTPIGSATPLTVGEWHCVELTLDIADAGRVQVFLDDARVVDQSGVDTLPIGGIGAVAMGSEWAGSAASVDVDRVLVTPTRVGCWE